ncbi:unnamed protein product [Schistocephalus solidus]|uniref:Glucose-induced degradation protein 8 homolog n=2 Tax=Schistocephalus solidus TaxID=70667 RepID=A0A183T2Q9_SCHSO|nr:unnamed protein product [Schistocephalus solidus]
MHTSHRQNPGNGVVEQKDNIQKLHCNVDGTYAVVGLARYLISVLEDERKNARASVIRNYLISPRLLNILIKLLHLSVYTRLMTDQVQDTECASSRVLGQNPKSADLPTRTSQNTSSLSYNAFEGLDTPSSLSLTRQEINRLILEYLIVEGYKDAAEKFSREIGVSQPLTEIHSTGASLAERMAIREAVLSRRIDETIDRVNELWPELFDKNPYIYFQLRLLQMLELIRGHRLEEALTFSQSYLADLVTEHPQLLHEMQKIMSLLAFDKPSESIHGNLLSARHAELIAGALNRAILWHLESSGGETDATLGRGSSTFSEIGQIGSSSTVPRLTKLMALLLHFRDIAHLDLPAELASL